MGLVSQIASAWHGFDVQASSRWHSSPVAHRQIPLDLPGSYWGFLQLQPTHCIIWQVVHYWLVGNYHLCFQGSSSSPLNMEVCFICNIRFYLPGYMFWEAASILKKAASAVPTYTLHSITSHHITEDTLRPQYLHNKNLKSHLQVRWKVATFLTSEVSSTNKAPHTDRQTDRHRHTHTLCHI